MKKPAEIFTEFHIKINAISDKEERIKEIVDFSTIYGDCFGAKIIPVVEYGIELSREIGYIAGETLCLCQLGFAERVTGINVQTKYSFNLQELTKKVEEIKHDKVSYSLGLNLISYFHWFRGEYELAFNLAFECLKLEEENAVVGVAWNNFGLAVFYFDTKDFENSKKHYQKALKIFKDLDHEYGKARSSNGLGTIAIAENQINDAIPLLEYAAGIYRQMGHYSGLSRAVNDMGLLEKANGNFSKAVLHLKESIELRKEIEHIQGLITSYTELGETYQLMNDHTSALQHLEQGLALALDIKAQQKQMRLHKLMYDTFKSMNNTELALSHFEKFFEVKSKILSDEASNNIKKVQTRYEKEKSEQEAELERFKNVELKRASTIIEQKNKDITDSINYAKRIQLGILPSQKVLDKYFDDYFVFYNPKDIVSGDFYWSIERFDSATNDKYSVIAAVDCTGHGVPGAFMSMLANTLLNQIITYPDVKTPAEILNYLNHKLPENLKSTEGEQDIRDGMDMGLCIFDFKNRKMQFAGANNPCWIIRHNEIIELKGDKQPISASPDSEKKKFSNQTFDLENDDIVYLITDGFADQFGGPKGKKYGHKRLRELLLANNKKSCKQQKEILIAAFNGWRGSLEQVDDVCVIGIKVT